MNTLSVLVVDDEPVQCKTLAEILQDQSYDVSTSGTVEGALDLLRKRTFDVVITDFRMPSGSGLDLAKKVRELCPESVTLIMTAYADVESVIEAMRIGVLDYFLKPLNIDLILHKLALIREQHDLQKELAFLRAELHRKFDDDSSLIGDSVAMIEARKLIEQVATTKGTVLITGESGTGKEVAARQIHKLSAQQKKKFVGINCGAIPENLLESELFGHKKGSFTSATDDKDGLFVVANGGTLFLDEIGEMPRSLQVKLLRVLQEREVLPVGGSSPIKVDVRIIAATNRNLLESIQSGGFRSDLFYRINVVEVKMPALREHVEDLPGLAKHFIAKFARDLKKPICTLSNEAIRKLMAYSWPGNVRELENVIERAMILHRIDPARPASAASIEVCDLPSGFQNLPVASVENSDLYNLDQALRGFSRGHIAKVLEAAGHEKKEAARMLGMSLSSLYRKMEELEIMTKKEDLEI